jgi:PAS domain S-box-containing protein
LDTTHTARTSLFKLLHEQTGRDLPIVRCTKATLVHLSHSLEDLVLRGHSPTLIFAGFQESRHWQKESTRYQELAGIAEQICVFAGSPLSEDSSGSRLYIELHENDPMRQEWFLMILSRQFAVVLCGLDTEKPAEKESLREFDTIWTFEPRLVNYAADTIEQVIEHYRPDRLAQLQDARLNYPPPLVNPALITHFTLELVRFEEKLNRELTWQKNLMDTLLASISHQVYVNRINPDGSFSNLYHSPNFESLTGYPPREVIENWPEFMEKIIHPDDLDVVRAQVERLEQGISQSVEYRLIRPDGSILWLQDSVHVQTEPETGSHMIYGVIQDITERKGVEKTRREQEAMRIELRKERELNILKNFFMSNVSHEFRTPLATILSSTELLERYEGRLTGEQRTERLQTIRSQVLHMTQMLDDISFVINDRIGQLGFNPTEIEIDALVAGILKDAEVTRGGTHSLIYHNHSERQTVFADARLLQHILTNLISNAIQYSPYGSEVRCEVNVSGDWLTLIVADQGIGIPDEARPRLFEPFYRASNVGSISGVGLGLKIVHDCVMIHRGTISCDSQVGEGTTFTVRIPLTQPLED